MLEQIGRMVQSTADALHSDAGSIRSDGHIITGQDPILVYFSMRMLKELAPS